MFFFVNVFSLLRFLPAVIFHLKIRLEEYFSSFLMIGQYDIS